MLKVHEKGHKTVKSVDKLNQNLVNFGEGNEDKTSEDNTRDYLQNEV